MTHCTRAQAVDLGNGYSLFFMHGHGHASLPSPTSRSFELPGDTLHFAPDRPGDVKHVKLEIALDFERESVSGTVYTTFTALYEEVTSVAFDAIELAIDKITIADGAELKYSLGEKKLYVELDRPYKNGEEFTVAITYHATPRIGLHFVKPAPEDSERPVHAYTFGQPQYHSYWFPCHDSPNDRATTEFVVTVPAQYITVANGNLLEVIDNGETKTHHWLHNVPHAAYLVSLVVGEFAVIKDEYKGKAVSYYVRKDRAEDARLYMGKTPDMMRFYSEYTGVEYPYDNYDQTVVEIYTGAMEHTTATTHSFALLFDQKANLDMAPRFVSVTAHELAHQWFGDLVTCRDWPNAWLNEGFATYFENMWTGSDQGEDYFKWSMIQEKKGYMAQDRSYRRPVVYHKYNNQGFELFDTHIYNKGAWVLHMLRSQLGDAAFRRGIKSYIERNRTREVITADLERALEESSGRSLAHFFQQWIYSGGYPEFEVNYTWDNQRKLAKVKVKQTQKIDELTPCFKVPVEIAFTVPTSNEGDTRVVPLHVTLGEDEQVEESFYLPLEREPLMVRFDPNGTILKTLRFERPTGLLVYQLEHDSDVLGRIEAAESLADRREPEALKALIHALNNDTFWGVRTATAESIAKHGSTQAQDALLTALNELDTKEYSRVRSAIATALGEFQSPEKTELAKRSAEALRSIVEQGDVSYMVESAASSALGKTRVEGSTDALIKALERPSWLYIVQGSIFSGLAKTGDERVVDLLISYASDDSKYITLRRGALAALSTIHANRHLYSEAALQRALAALKQAVEHDTWGPSRATAARALLEFGDKSALPALESASSHELDDGVQRSMRWAAHSLRTSDKGEEQVSQLRKDLEEMRAENRKLQDQLAALEARLQ
ncbi:M1 family aminopeptidase [Ktedonospora formicarum]|uniref:Aminopeptidase N n=1 Tax=Ktedonospora formicarum TaxID=2778364 RepID=A0A8J3I0F8_9CHLR|nr:M1 family aminopeptidase [Ktedonospora formicarum]GHO43818.1 aminopeptidase [Ktedonospora formicarum]